MLISLTSKYINKAVLIGLIVDILGTAISIGIIDLYGILHHTTEGKRFDYYTLGYYIQPNVLVIQTIVGLLFVILGGYVAGRIEKENKIQNACMVGFLDIIASMLLWVVFGWGATLFHFLIALFSFLLIMPCAYYGGWLSSIMDKHTNSSS